MMDHLLPSDRWISVLVFCVAVAALMSGTIASAGERSWTGDIDGTGPDHSVTVIIESAGAAREVFTATVTNTGTAPWGDFHFGIFDPMGGQNITNVDFLDASMGGEDPTSSQSGLTWVIDDVVVGATIDLYFCSDPVMPGETAVFTIYFVNPDQITFPGVLFYPTPVPPDGACCAQDGSCLLKCEHDCLPPNEFHPDWLSCTPNPCRQPPGACCFTDGHCEVLTEELCAAAPEQAGWIAGGVCTPLNPCEQPGACCDLITGSCTFVLERFCLPPLEFHAEWTSCVPNNCPLPVPARNTTWGEIKATYR